MFLYQCMFFFSFNQQEYVYMQSARYGTYINKNDISFFYRSLYQNGNEYPVNSYEVIFYQQPNPKHLQFLALNPLDLDISPKEPPKDKDEKEIITKNNLNKILDYSVTMVGDQNTERNELLSALVQVNTYRGKEHHIYIY